MRKFRFRLQKLLEIRRLKEDLARQELARVRQALDRDRADLARLKRVHAGVVEELRAAFEGTLDVDRISNYYRYLSLLAHRIEYRQAAVDRLACEEAAKRAAAIAARRERRIAEKLRERAYARYRAGVASMEQAFLDEVSTTRFAREGGDKLNGSSISRALGQR